jgi:hypothetical protein
MMYGNRKLMLTVQYQDSQIIDISVSLRLCGKITFETNFFGIKCSP